MRASEQGVEVFDELAQEIDELRSAGLYREPRVFEGASERVMVEQGGELVCLASNNYLGLTMHSEVVSAASEAARRYGAGSGASRLVSGTLELHEELETELARFKNAEAALFFANGFAANLGTISALVGREDAVFSDELNHASIIDGCRLSKARLEVYRHADTEDLRRRLEVSGGRRRLIVTDGVFSMDGDVAPLPGILQAAEEYGAWVLVDDAHATGVLGPSGAGTADHYGLEHTRLIQLGTLSKALGSEGGYVTGPRVLVDYLRHRARPFVYSTAPAPAVVAAGLAALRIVREEPERRQRLRENIRRLRASLLDLGYEVPEAQAPILPVIVGDADKAVHLSKELENRGAFVPAIRPPTVPEGTSRLRATLMATHTPEDLDRVIGAFKRAG